MNACVATALLAMVSYLLLLGLSSNEMRRLADRLNARADARDFRALRYRAYRDERRRREDVR